MIETHDSIVGRKSNLPIAVTSLLCACMFVLMLLSGCSSQESLQPEEEPKTASQYMVDLNDCTVRLSDKLSEFMTAVSEGKISAMETKSQEAFAILDEMSNLEAPDDVSDLKSKYSDASSQLKGALSDYMGLYTEIYDSSPTNGFDYSTYAQRIEDIQKKYDSAVGAFEDADKQASDM